MSWLFSTWWSWVAPAALHVALLALVVGIVERILPERTWPQLRAALWWVVLLRLLSPTLSSLRWGGEVDLPSFGAASPWWVQSVALIWILGVGVTAAELLRRRRSANRRLRQLSRADARWQEIAADLSRRVGLKRVPEVRVGEELLSPFVSGVFRPTIYLPEDLARREAEDLKLALVHELLHVRRRDLLSASLTTLMATVYWFHPAVWWGARRLNELREQCCDQEVARLLGDETERYRAALLRFTRRVAHLPAARRLPAGAAHGIVGPAAMLRARLRILDNRGRERLLWRRVATFSALCVALLLAAPMIGRAESRALGVAEWLDRPPGCFELRLLTMQRIAQEAKAQADRQGENSE